MSRLPFQNFGVRGTPPTVKRPTYDPIHNAVSGPGAAPNPQTGSQSDEYVGLNSQVVDLSTSRPNPTLQKDLSGGQKMQVSGNYVWIPFTTNVTDVIAIQIGDRDPVFVQAGTSVIGMSFDYLIVYNDAIASAKACIGYGFAGKNPPLKFG